MLLSFALGVLSTVAALAWALSSRRRATWAARMLLRAAGPSQRVYHVGKPPTKREQRTREFQAWRKIGETRYAARRAEQQQRIADPNHPGRDFLDSELCS